MSDKQRTYTTSFKYEAAALVIDQGYSYPTACDAVGVGKSHLAALG